PQTITFDNPGTQYFGTTATLVATSSAGVEYPVTFTSATTTVCTVAGATVTFVSVGDCTIAANQAGDNSVLAANQVSQTFTVAAGNQTISFTEPTAQDFDAALTLTATATSNLAVSFSSTTTAVCTITAEGELAFVSAGTCTITANQAGNGNWNAATPVSHSFTVNAIAPTAPTIGTATAGDSNATVTFDEPASTGGSAITAYTVTSNPGNVSVTGTGSPLVVEGLTNGVPY